MTSAQPPYQGEHQTQTARGMPGPVKVVLAVVFALAVAFAYDRSSLQDYAETQAAFPYLFDLRTKLGRAPEIHPQLKIISLDDTTLQQLGRPELSLGQWVELLEGLAARGPRAIFIDQIFGIVPQSATDPSPLLRRLEALPVPVMTGGFLVNARISGRPLLEPKGHPYDLTSYWREPMGMLKWTFPPMERLKGWSLYGPHPDLRQAFRRVGHVLDSGRGLARAVIQTGNNTVIPHLSMLEGGLAIERGRLMIDGQSLPTNRNGRVLVNFSARSEYYRKSSRLGDILRTIEAGRPAERVAPGDMVLILPSMFTGNADFTETPIGPLPGGLVIASLLNSRLHHSWILPVDTFQGPVYAGVLLGILAAGAAGPWSIAAVLTAGFCWLVIATMAFVYFGWYLGFTTPLLALVLTADILIAERSRLRERLFTVLRLLRDQNELLSEEIEQAGEIARAFMPARAPQWPGYTVGVYHKPLTAASGDWYAFESSPSGRWRHFIMCDISGHGPQAAIIVSTCKTVLSLSVEAEPASLDREDFLTEYATRLNRTLHRQGHGRHTATFLGLTFDSETGEILCICSGHPRPIHLQAGERHKAVFLGRPNSIIGLLPTLNLKATRHFWQPGDSLLAYTDGVPFPRSLTRVTGMFTVYRHLDPDSAARSLVATAREQSMLDPFTKFVDDDASLVLFKWKRAAKEATGGPGRLSS